MSQDKKTKPWFLITVVVAVIVIAVSAVFIATRSHKEVELKPIVTVDNKGITLSNGSKNPMTKVDIFEDFSCIHCAHMENASYNDGLDSLSKNVKINYRILAYMDDSSTRTLTAAVAVARTQPDKFYDFHADLFSKRDEYMGMSEDKLKERMRADGLGKSADAYDDSIGQAKAIAKNNSAELSQRTGRGVATPMVFVNDQLANLEVGPDGEPSSWANLTVKQ